MQQMKRLILLSSVVLAFLVAAGVTEAVGGSLPLSQDGYDEIFTKNIIAEKSGMSGSGETWLETLFRNKFLHVINRVLGGLGILMLVMLGAKFIFSQGDSEKLTKYKSQFGWIVLGLVLISMAEFVGFRVFDPTGGQDMFESSLSPFAQKITEVIRYFEYLVGGLMLVAGIWAGFDLITGGDSEETVSKEKQFFMSFLVGAGLMLMAEVLIRIFALRDGAASAAEIAVSEVAGIVNFALAFISGIAVLMLILAGLYYVVSMGDEAQMGRAKRMVLGAVVGCVVAFCAYAISRFLITPSS